MSAPDVRLHGHRGHAIPGLDVCHQAGTCVPFLPRVPTHACRSRSLAPDSVAPGGGAVQEDRREARRAWLRLIREPARARRRTALPVLSIPLHQVPPYPRFPVSSHSLVFLSHSISPGSGLSPPSVTRCRQGTGVPSPPRVVWSNYPLAVPAHPSTSSFRSRRPSCFQPAVPDVCSTATFLYRIHRRAPRTSAPPPRYALRTPGAPSTRFMYVLYQPAGRCAHGCGTLCESLDVLVTLATLPCGQRENKGDWELVCPCDAYVRRGGPRLHYGCPTQVLAVIVNDSRLPRTLRSVWCGILTVLSGFYQTVTSYWLYNSRSGLTSHTPGSINGTPWAVSVSLSSNMSGVLHVRDTSLHTRR